MFLPIGATAKVVLLVGKDSESVEWDLVYFALCYLTMVHIEEGHCDLSHDRHRNLPCLRSLM